MTNTISAEKSIYGFWVFSALSEGRLVTRRYEGYTKKEALKLFKEELESANRIHKHYDKSLSINL